ncbi:outer membrane protein assembly factor BamB family protein [Natrialba asiatica]|uniref:Pyrrolo-quinoline quinone n=1 Tax=Natrialba asiatica (strain ATCC 700177 / DSM 12278 / JCM 9576 / FERM P-10747 / NBRC 102637 / 172P1) TaxID=29540 RepID=M0AJ50_NATA1|nr:PQQ-binding-like beta-propeller repeat protein [Natrialba asiatica]ELY97912.1 hypothetical protein C481_18290 [Natrialba asiatica DSM 12278]
MSAGPQPTDHEVVPGCSLTRRQALQAAAAVGAASIGTAASSGTVAADGGVVNGLKEAVTKAATTVAISSNPASLAVFVGAIAVNELQNSVSTSISADRHILHQHVHNEIEWMDSHLVNFGNYMQDTRPIASLEARHGMATAWEDGENSTTAYDYALQRIRQYYELPEFNNLHVGNKALLQLMYIHKNGMETSDPYPVTGTAYIDGVQSDSCQMRFTDAGDTQTVNWELHDGTVVDENAFDDIDHIDGADGVPESPVIEFRDFDTGDMLHSQPITQDVLDSYDPESHPLHGQGQVTFTSDDGTQYVTDLRFGVQNVGDASEDPSLGAQRAFDGLAWLDLHDRISTLSDDVVSRYDQSFIEDIYGELDAGNITPQQVRSPEGMARFLSGTDDPANDRFQIAWMQQFGFARADMSQVRGMAVNWTGSTDSWVDSDPNLDARHVYPAAKVENKRYDGVLFASDVPDSGLESGGQYAVGTIAYSGCGSNTLHAFDALTGETCWSQSQPSTVMGVATVPGQDLLFTVNGTSDGAIRAIDPTDGTEKWTVTPFSSTIPKALVATSDAVIVSASGASTIAFDVSSGDQMWSSNSASDSLSLSPDGDTLLVPDASVVALYANDGTERWTYGGLPNNATSAAISPDGNTMVCTGTAEAHALALPDSGGPTTSDQKWIKNSYTSNTALAAVTNEYGIVALANGDLFAYTLSDGTQQWQSGAGSGVNVLDISPDGSYVFEGNDAGTTVFDVADGTQVYSYNPDSATTFGIAFSVTDPVDGMIARSIMFDEGTDDRDGEGQIDLWNGVVEIGDMWDANGDSLTHVSDQTIADIEALSGTPDSIDTVVADMDQFDSQEDIMYTRDVQSILEHYGVEGQEGNVTTEEPDYSSPEYDSFDSSEYAEEMAALEEKIDQLESEQGSGGDGDGGLGLPNFGFGDGSGGVVGLAIIGVVVLAVVGFVTDLIPGVGE